MGGPIQTAQGSTLPSYHPYQVGGPIQTAQGSTVQTWLVADETGAVRYLVITP